MGQLTQRISPVGCGILPGRRKPALWEVKDGEVRVLAYFVDRYAMDAFLAHHPRVNQVEVGGDE